MKHNARERLLSHTDCRVSAAISKCLCLPSAGERLRIGRLDPCNFVLGQLHKDLHVRGVVKKRGGRKPNSYLSIFGAFFRSLRR